MKLTRNKIMIMENKCNDDLVSGRCANITCKDCSLNGRYRKFVGLGMEELDMINLKSER